MITHKSFRASTAAPQKVDATQPQTAAGIMQHLMASASLRRKETLGRLVDACDNIGAKGKISLVEIQRYVTAAYGPNVGPRAQSISNERQLDLGMYSYVQARERERAKTGRRASINAKRAAPRRLEDRVEQIEDIDLRADMRDVIDRLNVAEGTAARATALLKTLRVGPEFESVGVDRNIAGSVFPEKSAEVDALREIIEILTNDETLGRCGLAIRDGCVVRKSGMMDILVPAEILSRVKSLHTALEGEANEAVTQGGPADGAA